MKARRWWGWPVLPVYTAVVGAKSWMYGRGWLRVRKLQWPVVSVGSLSAGGAGKTPVVIALVELLKERGWRVDVLSRGYGREGRGVERVETAADGAARRFGDEPVMIARRTGVGVWVGTERFAAGTAAEESAKGEGRGTHVLDDGFQHRRLGRAMDVVVVTADDLEDAMLPAGNRREGLRALRRADAVVVREEEQARVAPRLNALLPPGVSVWVVRRLVDYGGTAGGLRHGDGVVAFCGIARPKGFFAMVRATGVRLGETIAFADHHRYTMEDMDHLTEAARTHGCDGFVTTEKDAVKLTRRMRARLEGVGPLSVALLEAVFADEATVVQALEARLG